MVEETLSSVGFSPEMQAAPVASLSGGWKMKLALGEVQDIRANALLNGLDLISDASACCMLSACCLVHSSTVATNLLLAAARAMLMRADIMLLDEPTNHLDVTNVAWLEKYLTGLDNVTSMIVSHDSGFLDNVCTDIIHYEDRKLKRYRVCMHANQVLLTL